MPNALARHAHRAANQNVKHVQGRPNLLSLCAALEAAIHEVGTIRTETIRQANILRSAGLNDEAAIKALRKAEASLAAAAGEVVAAKISR